MSITTPEQLDIFTAAYCEAVDFTETGESGQPPAGTEWHPWAEIEARDDCEDFLAELSPAVWAYITRDTETLQRAGHDFWLTRQGHGAGFWDGDWPDHVDRECCGLCGWRSEFGELDGQEFYDWDPRLVHLVSLDERGDWYKC